MPDDGLTIGDVVRRKADGRRGVVCGVAAKDYTRGPKTYRVAWECEPPAPPELDPVGVWDREYAAEDLSREAGRE